MRGRAVRVECGDNGIGGVLARGHRVAEGERAAGVDRRATIAGELRAVVEEVVKMPHAIGVGSSPGNGQETYRDRRARPSRATWQWLSSS